MRGFTRRTSVGLGLYSKSSDEIAPTLLSAIIPSAGTTLVLTYNEPLDTGSVPATGDFSLAGTDSTVDSVGVGGSAVTIMFDTAVFDFQTITVSYTAGTNPIRDIAENNAANLTTQAVTNGSAVENPAVIDDGNTVAWYDKDEYITKDGSNLVSVWGDKANWSIGSDLITYGS